MAIMNGTDRTYGIAPAKNEMGPCCARCKTPGFGCANGSCGCHKTVIRVQSEEADR